VVDFTSTAWFPNIVPGLVDVASFAINPDLGQPATEWFCIIILRLDNKLTCGVDVTIFTIYHNASQPFTEITGRQSIIILRLDDDLACGVDVTPFLVHEHN